jgi:hypothetical protein
VRAEADHERVEAFTERARDERRCPQRQTTIIANPDDVRAGSFKAFGEDDVPVVLRIEAAEVADADAG